MILKTFHHSIVLFILACLFMTGCVFIDDDCHYETKCNYITQCKTVCDQLGYNCSASKCYDVVDKCWDEYVCNK